MKRNFLFPLRFIGFWLLFFLIFRILFAILYFAEFSDNIADLLLVFVYALRIDLSTISYLILIPFLFSIPSILWQSERGLSGMGKVILFFHYFLVVLVSLIFSGEIATYGDWQSKLSPKVFMHLSNPDEVFRTASVAHTVMFLFSFILLVFVGVWLSRKIMKKWPLEVVKVSLGKRLIGVFTYFVITAGALVIMIRGGVQQIPITATSSYFSKNLVVNDLSVNSVWNFAFLSFIHFKQDLSKYYQNIPEEQAKRIANELYEIDPRVSTQKILQTDRPNIVLVILEGWSAQMVSATGGLEDVAPNFNQLVEEGVFFTNIYASSGTSETGHSSIFSGYPTITGFSITQFPDKCRSLPGLNQPMQEMGYEANYYFGGDISYGNIGGYLHILGMDHVQDENGLSLEPAGKLGIHDEAILPYFFNEIKQARQPYFYSLFTQSTHPPYDMPSAEFDSYEDDGYISSVHYSDFHIKKFMDSLKSLPEYDKTLVVFVSDHGRPNIKNSDVSSESFFHIPMLFCGGALRDTCRGMKIDKIGSHTDLAKTLLNQLDLPSESFHWSKDLLNPSTKEWAITSSTLMYGFKNTEGYAAFQIYEDMLIKSSYESPETEAKSIEACRSVLEEIYREFEKL